MRHGTWDMGHGRRNSFLYSCLMSHVSCLLRNSLLITLFDAVLGNESTRTTSDTLNSGFRLLLIATSVFFKKNTGSRSFLFCATTYNTNSLGPPPSGDTA